MGGNYGGGGGNYGGGGGGYGGGGGGYGGGGGGGSGPSDKQMAFIRTLIMRLEMKDDEFNKILTEKFQVNSLEELGRGDASGLIDELKERADKLPPAPGQGNATEKQVKFMKSLKKRAKLDDAGFTALLQEVAKVATAEEVGKKEASAVIDKLLSLAGETPKPAPGARGGARGRFAGRGRAPAPASDGAAPAGGGGAAPDERPPDRPGDGPSGEDEDLPF
jgi:hypothetical protein